MDDILKDSKWVRVAAILFIAFGVLQKPVPWSTQTAPASPHVSEPTWHGAELGTHDAPAAHALHAPAMHTPSEHAVPSAALVTDPHAPLHSVVPTWHTLPPGLHVAGAIQASAASCPASPAFGGARTAASPSWTAAASLGESALASGVGWVPPSGAGSMIVTLPLEQPVTPTVTARKAMAPRKMVFNGVPSGSSQAQ